MVTRFSETTTLKRDPKNRKSPNAFKTNLKRGMTVKFQDNEDILKYVEKNQGLVKKYCKDRSFKKRNYRLAGVSLSRSNR